MPATIRRKRGQEIIDCHALTTRLLRQAEPKDTIVNRHVTIRRNNVDVVHLDGQLISDLDDRQLSDALQDFGQHTDMPGIQMLNQHERHAALRRRAPKELLECVVESCLCATPLPC